MAFKLIYPKKKKKRFKSARGQLYKNLKPRIELNHYINLVTMLFSLLQIISGNQAPDYFKFLTKVHVILVLNIDKDTRNPRKEAQGL